MSDGLPGALGLLLQQITTEMNTTQAGQAAMRDKIGGMDRELGEVKERLTSLEGKVDSHHVDIVRKLDEIAANNRRTVFAWALDNPQKAIPFALILAPVAFTTMVAIGEAGNEAFNRFFGDKTEVIADRVLESAPRPITD